MINVQELIAAFQERYRTKPRVFRAPGRVNLIGEHTDYNDGFVLPMAIDRATVVAIARRKDRIVRVWSMNLDDSQEMDLDRPGAGRQGTWMDYVEGITVALADRGLTLAGADIALTSDVGIGSGLSSSAALEISIGAAMVAAAGSAIDKLSLALAGQAAEHRHVGIQCGIMDQYTSVHATQDHAILLDCRSLEAKHIPINLGEYEVVVCDSRVRHTLASSEYNRRRRDCQSGVQLLQTVMHGIRALRDVTLDQIEAHRTMLPDSVLRRCRHVVGEISRTVKAAEALSSGNMTAMGALMSESHESLRDDYEVSCRELDILVESAMAQPGVLGARMTGGGFGGCTVNLVPKDSFESFRTCVSHDYQNRTRIAPEIFPAHASAGAGEIG